MSEESGIIGADTRVEGKVHFAKSLTVHGLVDGRIETDGHLHVAGDGSVKGEIHAGSIVIEGRVEARVEAQHVLVGSSGVVLGAVVAERLELQEGAVLQGPVETAG